MVDKFKKRSKMIREMSSVDPNLMIDHLSNTHSMINSVAPNISPHIHGLATKSINFLQEKLPKPQNDYLGTPEWTPSKSQIQLWNHYHDIIDDPISVLKHVKDGSFTNHHLEVLNNVYPELYQEMQNMMMEQMHPKNLEKMPYSTKIALSKFMGMPLEASLLGQNILSNQGQFAQGQQVNQGNQGNKSTVGGMKEIDLGQRSATMIQKDEADQE
jgi:hypothetical protein